MLYEILTYKAIFISRNKLAISKRYSSTDHNFVLCANVILYFQKLYTFHFRSRKWETYYYQIGIITVTHTSEYASKKPFFVILVSFIIIIIILDGLLPSYVNYVWRIIHAFVCLNSFFLPHPVCINFLTIIILLIGPIVHVSTRTLYFYKSVIHEKTKNTFEMQNIANVPAVYQFDINTKNQETFCVNKVYGTIPATQCAYIQVSFKPKKVGLYRRQLWCLILYHVRKVILTNGHVHFKNLLADICKK